jgi:hypothetical protein
MFWIKNTGNHRKPVFSFHKLFKVGFNFFEEIFGKKDCIISMKKDFDDK